jgi:uncharacterized protein YecE (DUF72 family)
MSDAKTIRIGCQSWSYDDWVTKAGGETVFYPRGTKPAEMLPLYSQVLDTIEVDSTAYGVPQISAVEGWYEKTPDSFVFSLKVPRAVTHEFSLRPGCYPIIESFVAAARHLKQKLGVILVQLPASFEATKENAQSVRDFLAQLPRDVKFAVEFRNSGWFVDWTFEEFASSAIPLALVEGKWVNHELMFAAADKAPADFAYIRFMGIRDLDKFDRIYRSRDENLDLWMETIKRLNAREVYIYVDNYYEGHAPATVNKIKERLNLPITPPAVLEEQPSLF